MTNCNLSVSKKYLLGLFTNIFLFLLSFLVSQLEVNFATKVNIFSVVGNIQIVIIFLYFKERLGTFINQYSLFLLSYYIFSFGQIAMFSFGLTYKKFNLLSRFPQDVIIKYSIYYLLSTIFIQLGSYSFVKSDSIDQIIPRKRIISSLKKVGYLYFIISAPVYFYNLINYVRISMTVGYSAIYNLEYSSTMMRSISSLEILFIPSLFMLVKAFERHPKKKKVIYLLLIISLTGLLMTGSRSRAFAVIIALIYFKNDIFTKFRFKHFLLSILFIVIFSSLIPLIQEFRNLDEKTFSAFISLAAQSKLDVQIFINSIGEMGGSMQPWLLVYSIVPFKQYFGMGISYLASFLAILPSFFTFGVSFSKYAQLSVWLQKVSGLNYGPGFSMLAESYYNFGWAGIPAMFIISKVYFGMISNSKIFKGVEEIAKVFISISLYTLITSGRNSLYLSLRSYVLLIIIPVLIIKELNKYD